MLLSMYNIMIKSTNNKNLVPVEVISLVPGAAVVRAGMTWMLNYNIIKMQTNKTNCGCGVLLIPGTALSGLAMTWMLFTMKLVPGTAVVRTRLKQQLMRRGSQRSVKIQMKMDKETRMKLQNQRRK